MFYYINIYKFFFFLVDWSDEARKNMKCFICGMQLQNEYKVRWTHATTKHAYFHDELKNRMLPFYKSDFIGIRKAISEEVVSTMVPLLEAETFVIELPPTKLLPTGPPPTESPPKSLTIESFSTDFHVKELEIQSLRKVLLRCVVREFPKSYNYKLAE
jgi:hypothetical protein